MGVMKMNQKNQMNFQGKKQLKIINAYNKDNEISSPKINLIQFY